MKKRVNKGARVSSQIPLKAFKSEANLSKNVSSSVKKNKMNYRIQRDLNKTLTRSINRPASIVKDQEKNELKSKRDSHSQSFMSQASTFRFKADARENSITKDKNMKPVGLNASFHSK